MKYYQVKIYVKFQHQALCILLFETEKKMNEFITSLNAFEDKDFITVAEFTFKRGDVKYVRSKEKKAK